MTEPVGALIALKLTHTPFSVSSVLGSAGAAGCFGGNRGYSGFLHQQTSPGRYGHPHGHSGGFAAAASSHHDDGSGRLPGLLPAALSTGIGSDTQKTVRHRDRRRPDLPPLHRIFRQSGAVRDGRPRRRCAAGLVLAHGIRARTSKLLRLGPDPTAPGLRFVKMSINVRLAWRTGLSAQR